MCVQARSSASYIIYITGSCIQNTILYEIGAMLGVWIRVINHASLVHPDLRVQCFLIPGLGGAGVAVFIGMDTGGWREEGRVYGLRSRNITRTVGVDLVYTCTYIPLLPCRRRDGEGAIRRHTNPAQAPRELEVKIGPRPVLMKDPRRRKRKRVQPALIYSEIPFQRICIIKCTCGLAPNSAG